MTPVDVTNYRDGQLRLATHHYGTRSETILMHVPSMRQFTVRPGAELVVAAELDQWDHCGDGSTEGIFGDLSVNYGRDSG